MNAKERSQLGSSSRDVTPLPRKVRPWALFPVSTPCLQLRGNHGPGAPTPNRERWPDRALLAAASQPSGSGEGLQVLFELGLLDPKAG
jgi:hypothetical protein